MSDRLRFTEGFGRLPIVAFGGGARGFLRDGRFSSAPEPLAPASSTHEITDPVERAFAEGYAQGAEDARSAADAQTTADDAAQHRIETTLARMDAASLQQFEERLRHTVLALCEAAVAPAAIDPEGLARRVSVAAGLFARASDERVIRLHPEDLALLHARLPEDWHCEPDSGLERGALRIEGAHGGVEDGPTQWRRTIEEALGQC